MMRVVVADKNETMRLGMKTLLKSEAQSFQVWEAGDRAALMKKAIDNNCNLVVIDPNLFPGGAEALIRDIRRELPAVNVLVYTELDERKFGLRAIRCGARGYVLKSSPSAELIAAVTKVGRGKLHMSETLAEEVALHAWEGRPQALHDALSDREMLVFCMLVCGWTVSKIAGNLHLSVKTVSTHKARGMAKLRCRSLSELVEYSISSGLKAECEARCSTR